MSEAEYCKKSKEQLKKLKGKKWWKKNMFFTLTIQGIDDLRVQDDQIVLSLRNISLFCF